MLDGLMVDEHSERVNSQDRPAAPGNGPVGTDVNMPSGVPTLSEELLRLADQISRNYFLPDGDADDLKQEARIGAWKAVRDFDPAHGMSFTSFARLCIERQVITAVKTSTRGKHQVLNHATRTAVSSEDGEQIAITDLLAAPPSDDPLFRLLRLESLAEMKARIDVLSPLERAATMRLAAGESYADMADLGSVKTIDNALTRARKILLGDTPTETLLERRGGERRLRTKRKSTLPWEQAAVA